MDTKECPCCHQDMKLEDRHEEAITTDSTYQEPCDSCLHREESADEAPCYFCVYVERGDDSF